MGLEWKNSAFESLIGKVANKVYFSDNQLYFDTDQGLFGYWVEADCCSSGWIYSLTNTKALLGQLITGVVEIEVPDVANDGLGRQEYDKVYGIGLKTDIGIFEFVYRNSSNGYYGSWLDPIPNPKITSETELTEDFIYTRK